MKGKSEWDELTLKWSAAFKKARNYQAILDDKMSACLNGTGRMPTLAELAKVEKYWEIHIKTRKATNKYIAKQINSNHIQYSGVTEAVRHQGKFSRLTFVF